MAHEMNRYLVTQGHHVDVLIPVSDATSYEYEGVSVSKDTFKLREPIIKNADVVISHLDRAGKALNLCEYYRKPYIQIIHNSNRFTILDAKYEKSKAEKWNIGVVYNSCFTRDAMRYLAPGVVVHPPVNPKRYKVTRIGDRLTLINLFHRKGTDVFFQLARLMPDRSFLGVEGAYGKQDKMEMPNIKYMANGPDMKKVYAQTRILLMPSKYESYGRTAVEAMCSGIPVIASPTPGLKESLGSAGIFAETDAEWVEAIRRLDDKDEYDTASKKCLDRFREIKKSEPAELEALEKFMFDLVMHRV